VWALQNVFGIQGPEDAAFFIIPVFGALPHKGEFLLILAVFRCHLKKVVTKRVMIYEQKNLRIQFSTFYISRHMIFFHKKQ